jgi:hypothetical protein
VLGQLQHAEDAEQPEYSDDEQVVAAGDEQAQVGGDDGQKVYDAPKKLAA